MSLGTLSQGLENQITNGSLNTENSSRCEKKNISRSLLCYRRRGMEMKAAAAAALAIAMAE